MTEDARFEDAGPAGGAALRLNVLDAGDLEVVSSLCQDAVFPASEIRFDGKRRQLVLLINRFRWEDMPKVATRQRPFERARALLIIGDVQNVQSQGFDRGNDDQVLSLLSVTFEPGDDGTGRLVLTLAGDGAIGVEIETLNVQLRDVTRPYIAPSRSVPSHD